MTKKLRFALLIALTPLMAGAALAAGPGGGGGGGGGGGSAPHSPANTSARRACTGSSRLLHPWRHDKGATP